MGRTVFPEFTELAALPLYLEAPVPHQFEDANGHLNVTGYLHLHDQAGWEFLRTIGVDADYRTIRKLSFFDLEHHIRYLAEVGRGDHVAVHGRLIGRTAKLLHGQFFMLDTGHRVLSSTFEFLSIHMSLETRRSAPWPDDVAENLDALIGAHTALAWDPPLSGAMGLG